MVGAKGRVLTVSIFWPSLKSMTVGIDLHTVITDVSNSEHECLEVAVLVEQREQRIDYNIEI